MHSNQSFLYTCLERVRGYLDDPDFDAKYDNNFLIRHIISPCMTDVWARINMNLDNPVVLRHDIAIDSDTEYYILPPSIGEVWRVAARDSKGRIVNELMPRNEFHPIGVGFAIEGNCLRVDPKVSTKTYTLYYVPSGDVRPHYGTTASDAGLAGDKKTFTLTTSPTVGDLDRRDNAYAGQILRIIPTSGKIEERVIETHTVADDGTATVVTRLPFTKAHGNQVVYEIAPIGMQSLYEAISAAASLKLGAYRKITAAHHQMITQQYRSAIKTATDNLANMQLRTGKYFDKNTVDNPAYGEIGFVFR